jgi:hypothetical protein
MALNIDYLYSFARKLIRKNQSGSLSADDFNKHWNDASDSYFDDLVGRFQQQGVGKSGVNTGLIQNKTILQKLAPFTKKANLTITSGSANKPADFIYELALRIDGADVIPINKDQISSANGSVIDPPSEDDEKYYQTEYEDHYVFFPNTVTSAELDYISNPVDAVWAYTIDGQERQVYDPEASVQSQWDDHSKREITKRMLTNLGVSLKDADFMQFGAKTQTMGE